MRSRGRREAVHDFRWHYALVCTYLFGTLGSVGDGIGGLSATPGQPSGKYQSNGHPSRIGSTVSGPNGSPGSSCGASSGLSRPILVVSLAPSLAEQAAEYFDRVTTFSFLISHNATTLYFAVLPPLVLFLIGIPLKMEVVIDPWRLLWRFFLGSPGFLFLSFMRLPNENPRLVNRWTQLDKSSPGVPLEDLLSIFPLLLRYEDFRESPSQVYIVAVFEHRSEESRLMFMLPDWSLA